MTAIFLTSHRAYHGISFMKMMLAAYYQGKWQIHDPRPESGAIFQQELATAFEKNKSKTGIIFYKTYYFYFNQNILDSFTTRRKTGGKKGMEEDAIIQQSGTSPIWARVWELHEAAYAQAQEPSSLAEEMAEMEKWCAEHEYSPALFAVFKRQYWQNIHHYPVEHQLNWFRHYSEETVSYPATAFEAINLSDEVDDLFDTQRITAAIDKQMQFLMGKHPDAHFVIDIGFTSYEMPIAWYVLAEAGRLPRSCEFILTQDDKAIESPRFRPIRIFRKPTRLISEVQQQLPLLFSSSKSRPRKLVEEQFKQYIGQGFSMLMLGERGVGKSRLVEQASKSQIENQQNDKVLFVAANCASFDDDSKAESELFGYVDGAFSNAKKGGEIGLFQQAANGILLLDEVHHLSKSVQAKLMRAIATDENGYFTLRRLGANKEEKIKCTLIFASNKSNAELRQTLLRDFYDRICQYIIELPPLRETPEDREQDWKAIWNQLGFQRKQPLPDDYKLINWLKSLPLYGNYRDLQKIAINYHAYLQFTDEIREMTGFDTPFNYVKDLFSKYHVEDEETSAKFSAEFTATEQLSTFKREFALWAKHTFGSYKKAAQHFATLGDADIKERAFYNWEKGDS